MNNENINSLRLCSEQSCFIQGLGPLRCWSVCCSLLSQPVMVSGAVPLSSNSRPPYLWCVPVKSSRSIHLIRYGCSTWAQACFVHPLCVLVAPAWVLLNQLWKRVFSGGILLPFFTLSVCLVWPLCELCSSFWFFLGVFSFFLVMSAVFSWWLRR
jgi:hypothetical protein